MPIRKKQYVIYGIQFQENELTDAQIENFYNNYDHNEAKLGTIVFIDSGMVGGHYWLGYLLAYGGGYCDLGITLDNEAYDDSVREMNTFLKDNELQDLGDAHHLYFHVITRWA